MRALLAPSLFTAADHHELELREIFERSWVHVADLTDVPEPGDLVPGAIGRTPVLVVRGHDGELRAFLNACPHRGATLAEQRGRCDKLITCPYHGWSFATDGSLRGVPFRAELGGDVSGRDLVPVRVATLGPMIFACLEPAAPGFEVWAGELREAFARTGIERWELAFERDYDVRVNWKVYVENGLEGYHIPVVHDVLGAILDLASGESFLEAHGSYTRVAPSPVLAPAGAGPAVHIRFGHLFPNLIPVLSPIDFTYLRIDPTGPETVRLRGRGFDAGADTAIPRAFREGAFHQTNLQDIAVVERVQRGLRARGLPPPFHSERFESRVTHFEAMVMSALPAPSIGAR